MFSRQEIFIEQENRKAYGAAESAEISSNVRTVMFVVFDTLK